MLKKINSKPEESLFIDDQEKNVFAARSTGMKGIIYKDIKQLKKELKKYFISFASIPFFILSVGLIEATEKKLSY